jgi:hypothetical protein
MTDELALKVLTGDFISDKILCKVLESTISCFLLLEEGKEIEMLEKFKKILEENKEGFDYIKQGLISAKIQIEKEL